MSTLLGRIHNKVFAYTPPTVDAMYHETILGGKLRLHDMNPDVLKDHHASNTYEARLPNADHIALSHRAYPPASDLDKAQKAYNDALRTLRPLENQLHKERKRHAAAEARYRSRPASGGDTTMSDFLHGQQSKVAVLKEEAVRSRLAFREASVAFAELKTAGGVAPAPRPAAPAHSPASVNRALAVLRDYVNAERTASPVAPASAGVSRRPTTSEIVPAEAAEAARVATPEIASVEPREVNLPPRPSDSSQRPRRRRAPSTVPSTEPRTLEMPRRPTAQASEPRSQAKPLHRSRSSAV